MMAVKKLLKRTRARKKKSISSPVQHNKVENKDGIIKEFKQKKTAVIAQEIKFARILASNDKNARAKMLKKLVNWITVRSQSTFVFTETDFLRLWKGLFYCMWMSDKPLVQEELAENISKLIHCFGKDEAALLYTKCTLKTLSTEWYGIDQYRIDKFQMLARRILRQTFVMCKNRNWDIDWTSSVGKVITDILLDPKGSIGFKFHITEIFMEELAKISEGNISVDVVTKLMGHFVLYMAETDDDRQVKNIIKNIFRYLIIQSDVGLEYMEKFEAWRTAGFPTGSIDAMEKVEVSDEEDDGEEDEDESEEEEEQTSKPKALDPRAGRVDVELPQIPFDASAIAALIKEVKFRLKSGSKSRRQVNRLIKEFTVLAQGKMPLGIHKVEVPKKKSAASDAKKAALKLLEFEQELYADSPKNIGKKKKKPESVDDSEEPAKKKMKKSMDSEEIHEEEIPEVSKDSKKSAEKLKKKKKLKKLSEQTIEKSTEESINEKPIKKSIKKLKSDEESSKEKTSPKKKSLQKEFKVKPSKIKQKKLKFIKSTLNGEIADGIDDFAVFKKSDLVKPISPKEEVEAVKESPKKLEKPKSPQKTPKKLKIIEDIKLNDVAWLNPVISKVEDEKTKLKTPVKTEADVKPEPTSSAKKRVKIVLKNNRSQHTSEYFRQLRLSPQIPFDANAKPRAGVLKSTPLANPVNPFYQKI